MNRFAVLSVLLSATALVFGQQTRADRGPFARQYHEDDTLTYRMKDISEGHGYEIQATGVIKKDRNGNYIEEYVWSDLVMDGTPRPLSSRSAQFRQVLSLDPNHVPSIPDLTQVDRVLIGPITDLLTFYSDLWLVLRSGKLAHSGDHLYQEHGTAASWADGKYVVLGEDSIDFDISIKEVNELKRAARLQIRHLPPKQPQVKLPAAWMRQPVADTPNNWVNVTKIAGTYKAAVGKETFDVELDVSLIDGKIVF